MNPYSLKICTCTRTKNNPRLPLRKMGRLILSYQITWQCHLMRPPLFLAFSILPARTVYPIILVASSYTGFIFTDYLNHANSHLSFKNPDFALHFKPFCLPVTVLRSSIGKNY